MATEIRPSLAQMLNPQAAAPAAPPRPQPAQGAQGGFASALAAQKAFFNQITTPQVTPPTYTAADVARATATATPKPIAAAPAQADASQPLRRPGSFLNIVV